MHSFFLSSTWDKFDYQERFFFLFLFFFFLFLHSISPSYLSDSLKSFSPRVNNHSFIWNDVSKNATVNCGCLLFFFVLITRQLTPTLYVAEWHYQTWRWHSANTRFLPCRDKTALPCSAYFKNLTQFRCKKGEHVWHLWWFLNIYWNASILYQKKNLRGFNLYTCSFLPEKWGGLHCNCCLIELVSFTWQDTLFN